jgi:hypothetical protein
MSFRSSQLFRVADRSLAKRNRFGISIDSGGVSGGDKEVI